MSARSHSPTPPARGSTGWWFPGFGIEVSAEDAIALGVQAGADVEGNPVRIVLRQRSKGIIGIARERLRPPCRNASPLVSGTLRRIQTGRGLMNTRAEQPALLTRRPHDAHYRGGCDGDRGCSALR